MQRELLPEAIDWVFCFRTAIGGVRGHVRWSRMNGQPVPYQPHTMAAEEGLRFIVRGRVRTCPLPPVGPRLAGQGAISRLCCYVAGVVTRGAVVPARDTLELEALRARARAMIEDGRAREWALASLAAGGQQRWGLYVSAPDELLSELATDVDAAFTVRVSERGPDPSGAALLECVDRAHHRQAALVECVDRAGQLLAARPADAVFDAFPLPAFVEAWRAQGDCAGTFERSARGNVIDVPRARPSGPGAWERWVRADEAS